MLPRWHILLGLIFSIILYFIFPQLTLIELGLVFLSSFLIDFDHYLVAVYRTRKIGFFNSLRYFDSLSDNEKSKAKSGKKFKSDLMIFHTLEFHILVLLLGLFVFKPFLFVLLGMIFHSLLDIIYLTKNKIIFKREFFLIKFFKELKNNKLK